MGVMKKNLLTGF